MLSKVYGNRVKISPKKDIIYIILITLVFFSTDENWKPHKLSQTLWPTLPITMKKVPAKWQKRNKILVECSIKNCSFYQTFDNCCYTIDEPTPCAVTEKISKQKFAAEFVN